MIEHWQHRQRIPCEVCARHQGRWLSEDLGKRCRDVTAETARVPVPSQPPHVGRQHGIRPGSPPEGPADLSECALGCCERLGVYRFYGVVSLDVDHSAGAVSASGKVIGRVAALLAALDARSAKKSGTRSRQRRDRSPASSRRRVQPMTRNRRGHPSSPRSTGQESPLPAERQERPYGLHPLKRDAPQLCNWPSAGSTDDLGDSTLKSCAISNTDADNAIIWTIRCVRITSRTRHAEQTRFSETSGSAGPDSMRHPAVTDQVQRDTNCPDPGSSH